MAAESSLEKIQEAFAKYAPSVEFIEPCDNEGAEDWCVGSMFFAGKKLEYVIAECVDGFCVLYTRESDCREAFCTLLRHEEWYTVAQVVLLLEGNGVGWIQTSEAIELRDRYGKVDMVVDSESCH
jgi:hypothetical protein